MIDPKSPTQYNAPYGFSFSLNPDVYFVQNEWKLLSEMDREHMKKEYKTFFDENTVMAGPVHIAETPLPMLRNKIGLNFSRDYIYFRKPSDFLRRPDIHFIRPDLKNTAEVEKIIDNPLSIGELIWQ